jgi:hypothetical protein
MYPDILGIVVYNRTKVFTVLFYICGSDRSETAIRKFAKSRNCSTYVRVNLAVMYSILLDFSTCLYYSVKYFSRPRGRITGTVVLNKSLYAMKYAA